ncbi:MAG: AbgT family transporter [Alkalibacterium sp.]|uniref:AbgT family transporter n=1 Tax=Alkalibacterium TaxID=99906 RepID=UPI0026489E53|nr:AbgT family transporter [Alkalibacterium sp.]MDN6194174.1 AbgT family transporter [Alkalibacterium sp.]MDN6293718.1 AbgT family transporter [Alkalibacterium sp.]MDN6295428.1 AbgT family transporter [Alkalibacterium sp.]MDN6326870.1 AbgT family transporter [Alkalibacterium sp.]MDN6398524.1 AbgT family transporter [Alkalibacterium sp.]
MNESEKRNKGFLGFIERIGNSLPHPVIIFVILALAIIVISDLAARFGAPVEYFNATEGDYVTVEAVSLLTGKGLSHIFNSAVDNFTGFAPLGTVLVAMLGVGVAEWSGLISSTLKKLLRNVPTSLLTASVVFAGIISNIASDAGYVVVIPLGAIIFAGAGRHPIAGLAAAFAGVSAGFSANLIFGPTDALLVGITNEALSSGGIDYDVAVTANWYFMIVSTFVLTIVGAFVTERIVEPRLGEYNGSYKPDDEPITATENKGMRNALIALLVFLGIMAFLMIPENGVLRTLNEETGNMTLDNFLRNGLLFMILLLFAIPGYFYGRTTGKIKTSHDLVKGMSESMASMGGYLVLAFFAAQFINYFSYTNLGLILAVNGADFLETIGFVGLPLILAFILVTAFINLFIGSASAKWAIMAPVFAPMLFEVNIAPEMTLMAYRIADSSTNIISPLMSYFAMVLVFAQRYDEKSGLGTIISTMLSYSIAFLITWSILLMIWFALGLPLGPGAQIVL